MSLSIEEKRIDTDNFKSFLRDYQEVSGSGVQMGTRTVAILCVFRSPVF